MKKPILTSNRRSALARYVYPWLSPKEAGLRVAHDIHTNFHLREQLKRAGYTPGRCGYSPEQMAILLNFYKRI